MRILFGAFAIFAATSTASLAQDQVTLTPQQYFAVGNAALLDGNLAGAAQIADILLLRNDADFGALFLRTQAAHAAQDFAGVVQFGARAYAVAPNAQASQVTARLVARGYADQERDTFAQLWLRRAYQYAPDDAQKNEIAREYQFLQARNPWSTSLRFGIAPSSNINGGTDADVFFLPGLPFPFSPNASGKPLSGYVITGGFDTSYRVLSTDTSSEFLTASLDYTTYALSKSTIQNAPDVKGSDFASGRLTFGYLTRQVLSQGALPTDFRMSVGQTWDAGQPNTQFASASVAHQWQLGDSNQVSGSFGVVLTNNIDGDPSSLSQNLNASWTHTLGNGDSLTFGLGATDSHSAQNIADFSTTSVNAAYKMTDPVDGMRIDVSFDFTKRTHKIDRFISGASRNDIIRTTHVDLNLTEIEIYGFQPVVTFQHSYTTSNVALHERTSTRVGFDLRSSF